VTPRSLPRSNAGRSTTLQTMDATPRLLEITPPRREGGPPAKLAIGVMLFPHVLILAVLVLLAVYLPFARIFLGVWVLWYALVGVMLARALRRRRRGVTHTPTLWVTSDSLGFTSVRGVTVSCPRTIVASALRVFATVNRQTRDLLVFRDGSDNAVLCTPLGVWLPEDIDRVTEALGIQPAGRKFVNSASELETAAHGAPLPPTFAAPRRHRWIVVLAIYVLVIAVVVVLLVTQR
jgi:hypothetical protein